MLCVAHSIYKYIHPEQFQHFTVYFKLFLSFTLIMLKWIDFPEEINKTRDRIGKAFTPQIQSKLCMTKTKVKTVLQIVNTFI